MDKEQKNIRKTIYEQQQQKSSKRQTLCNENSQILELKNTVTELKNSLEKFKSRFEQVDRKELSNVKKFEIIKSERQKRKKK